MNLQPELVLLVLVGVVAGAINVIAGGGSTLTLPVLILLGLPASVANGTNRLAVVVQSLVGYRQLGREQKGGVGPVAVIGLTLPGALIGAFVASSTPDNILKPLLLLLLVAVAGSLVFKPDLLLIKDNVQPRSLKNRPFLVLSLVAVGFYGGFIQAGVGYFLLFLLTAGLRMDFIRATALKLLAISAFGSISLLVFWSQDLVRWPEAVVLALSMAVGAVIGAQILTTIPKQTLRWGLLLIVVVLSALALTQ